MSRRPKRDDDTDDAPTMHRFTAKHYVITAILVILAVGMFAYRWS